MKSILIASRNTEVEKVIRSGIDSEYTISSVSNLDSALERLRKKRYDFIFMDMELLPSSDSGEEYEEIFQLFWDLFPTVEIVVLSSKKMIRGAVAAVKAGANHYLTYPLDPEEVKYTMENLDQSKIFHSELDYLRKYSHEPEDFELIRTQSPLMEKVFEKMRLVAPTKSNVLLSGETGTGKNVMAHLIHKRSNRRDAQFISVHCGAITESLLESELFGHEKGAFTGAVKRKLGRFEIANGGTIFLDEVGTISPSAQIKLLQILQDKTFQRVGGEEIIHVDVRIIAATNVDLEILCEKGQFRKDLYYRLNVFPIEIPPLRERKEDIPLLVEGILERLNRTHFKNIRRVHPKVIESFQSYHWPGNIREMENLIERAYIIEPTPVLTPESFPQELFPSSFSSSEKEFLDSSYPTLKEMREKSREDAERTYLEKLLRRHKGRIKDSAASAGISTRQLNKLMKKHNLRKEKFKA